MAMKQTEKIFSINFRRIPLKMNKRVGSLHFFKVVIIFISLNYIHLHLVNVFICFQR